MNLRYPVDFASPFRVEAAMGQQSADHLPSHRIVQRLQCVVDTVLNGPARAWCNGGRAFFAGPDRAGKQLTESSTDRGRNEQAPICATQKWRKYRHCAQMALCASKRVIACLKQLTHQELQFTDAIPDSPTLHVHPVRDGTRNFWRTSGAFLVCKPEIEATRTIRNFHISCDVFGWSLRSKGCLAIKRISARPLILEVGTDDGARVPPYGHYDERPSRLRISKSCCAALSDARSTARFGPLITHADSTR